VRRPPADTTAGPRVLTGPEPTDTAPRPPTPTDTTPSGPGLTR
jgi:hypothetical protein